MFLGFHGQDAHATFFRDKLQRATIDVWRKNRDAHPFTLADKNGNLFRIANFVAEQSGHELDRIMRLQIRSLITDQAVSGAVALVESVTGEFFEQIEDRVRLFFGNLVRARTALYEILPLHRHLFLVLLAHGAPK